MITGILMALETCLILGQVSHNLLYWKKKLQTDTCGPGGERRENSLHPGQIIYQSWKSMGKHAKLKEKQKWSNEKFHLENARKLRGICFIDPKDKEFKETIKNARKKLKTSIARAMPCKIMKNCGSGTSSKIKTRIASVLEANESTRMRGDSLPNHEDHIAAICSQINYCASSHENSGNKSSSGQGMGKFGEKLGVELDERKM